MADPALDPLIHELTRLRLTTLLANTASLEFATMRDALELSDSVLSKHLRRLANAGYVTVSTRGDGSRGRPRSWASLTRAGRTAYDGHLAALQELAAPR